MKNLYKLFAILILIVFSCQADFPLNESFLVTKIYDPYQLSLSKGAPHFYELDELARVFATHQEKYKQTMIEAMRQSAIKENIINLSESISDVTENNAAKEFAKEIKNIYSLAFSQQSKDRSLVSLLKNVGEDIHIYFPVEEHRLNVIQKNEDYWVTFNPPPTTNDEYFLDAYTKEGHRKKISSKISPSENVLVITYSENQEKYPDNKIQYAHDHPDSSTSLIPPININNGLFRLRTVSTSGLGDNSWLDGSLELMIEIIRPAAKIKTSKGYYFADTSYLMQIRTNHYSGYWPQELGGKVFINTQYRTQINAAKEWEDIRHLVVGNEKHRVDEFIIVVSEQDNNRKKHIGSVVCSIKKFAFVDPLIITSKSGEKVSITIDSI